MLLFSKFFKFILLTIGLGVVIAQISTANAAVYPMPPAGNDVVGEVITVRAGAQDTLLTIGNRYEVGMHEMLEANPQLHQTQATASQYLGRGKKVIVPTQYVLPPYRKGIVINMAQLRLYYFTNDGQQVYTYPVGLGRTQWRTPLTSTTVISKEPNPIWHVPASIHKHVLEETGKSLPSQVMPGPENPLGPYAMHLGTSGYLIHGTNQPWSIGKYISSGCIRMHDEDVTELYPMVKVGTPVHIINRANDVGWHRGQLYMQSRVPVELDNGAGTSDGAVQAVISSKAKGAPVDWNKVQTVVAQHTGIPQPIGGAAKPAQMAQADSVVEPVQVMQEQWPPVDRRYSDKVTYQVINVKDDVKDVRDSREFKQIMQQMPGVAEIKVYEY